MRNIVTSCAAVCLFLTSTGRCVANVSMPFAESWSELEVVENQSCILDTSFDLAAPVTIYALWAPGEPVSAAAADEGSIALPDSVGPLWPSISTRPAGYPGPGRELPLDVFAGSYRANLAYTYVDLTDLGGTSELDGLVFGPNLPFGAIVLGGVAVGLIGWLWRRRIFSCEKYP